MSAKAAVPRPRPDLNEQDTDRRIARQVLDQTRHAINTYARLTTQEPTT